MGEITTKQFQILSDMNLIWDFMVEIYDPRAANGVAAPFFEYALCSSWMDRSYTHLNRIWFDGGRVAAFVFCESPVTDVYFSLRPGYEWLADELVDYAESAMPNFDGARQLVVFGAQRALTEAVRRRGYEVAYESDDLCLDFDEVELNYPLPEGFRFVEPSEVDPLKLAVCTWKGFNHEDKGPFENWNARADGCEWTPAKAYNNVLSAAIAPPPHSTGEYDVIIADERGEYVCYSGMWWVPENRLAYMEPLCTVPEYRRRGLAAAALTRHYHRMKALGAKRMTGGNNEFYKRIGYGEGWHWVVWKRPDEKR